MARVLIIAPHWTSTGNVARRRLVDMRRWLLDDGHAVTVISGGAEGAAGEIPVPDPRAVYGNLRRSETRRFSRLRRWLREWRYLPDEGIDWAKRVASDSRVLTAARQSQLIVSSSPPESAHLAANWLSVRTGVLHLVDLQDGWLDEPLRPSLQEFAWRRRLEGRLEARVLRHGVAITVTTQVWRQRLLARYPQLGERVRTIRLAPPSTQLPPAVPRRLDGRMQLLHAGSFTLSHNRRRMELLLEPLLAAAAAQDDALRARVLLLGDLHPAELAQLPAWQTRFAAMGWRLDCAAALPQAEYFQRLAEQHGLLLLSASMGALPSKLFEYLALGRPILAVTPRGSAMWDEAELCPAVVRTEMGPQRDPAVLQFLRDCARRQELYTRPEHLEESRLRTEFLQLLEPWLRGKVH